MRTLRVLGAAGLAAAVGTAAAAVRVGTHSGVSPAERARSLPGDDVVPAARAVIDRAVTLSAPPERVWPWVVQLGKDRAGWYAPAWLERVVPEARRGLRRIDPDLAHLAVGDVVPDWGPGGAATFEVMAIDPPRSLVYRSERPRRTGEPLVFSWAHVLTPTDAGTRLHLRLRVDRIGRRAPAVTAALAGLFDEATVRPLFAGLAERLAADPLD